MLLLSLLQIVLLLLFTSSIENELLLKSNTAAAVDSKTSLGKIAGPELKLY